MSFPYFRNFRDQRAPIKVTRRFMNIVRLIVGSLQTSECLYEAVLDLKCRSSVSGYIIYTLCLRVSERQDSYDKISMFRRTTHLLQNASALVIDTHFPCRCRLPFQGRISRAFPQYSNTAARSRPVVKAADTTGITPLLLWFLLRVPPSPF